MRLALEQRRSVDFQGVALDHAQLARKRLAQFSERRDTAMVALDRGDACARRQQGAGQAAGAGANLQHLGVVQVAGNARDPRQQLRVEQEVLPQRLARIQAITRDDVA
ncbi:hypothetical protein D9M73_126870 [compost metagenome]